jgi:hypothetical protein
MKSIIKIKYQILLFLLVVVYFIYYGFYGYDDADYGYTLALSWRIINGELPYRDFFMVRPPFSPILHSVSLLLIPENYQLLFDRLLFYVLIALSSVFGALTINETFKNDKFNPYLLASVGFVFSTHNFPPMAWHTVDAVFFSSLGAFLIVKSKSITSICFGMLFLFLAALCKQPFYLLPVVGLIYIFISNNQISRKISAVLSLVIYILLFVSILYYNNILFSFLSLTTGSTTLTDLFKAGVISYLRIDYIYILIPFIIWLLLKSTGINFKFNLNISILPYLFISTLLFIPTLKILSSIFSESISNNVSFTFDTSKLYFVCTFLLLIANLNKQRQWLSLWFLLTVSWCASISWGYLTPVFFSLPLVYGVLYVSHRYFKLENIKFFAIFMLLIGLGNYFIAYQKPYCNPNRSELKYGIGGIFPKLSHIKVSREMHDKYLDFHNLHNKYGDNFKTLPGMPLSNYLTNTKPATKLDWVFNAESNYNNETIIEDLASNKTVVFLEKFPQLIDVSDSNEKFNSKVAYFIKMNWNLLESTSFFDVYRVYD